MKRTRIAALPVFAVIFSGLSLPALADTQGNVTLSDFSYRLKDLNTVDGLEPVLSWSANPSRGVFMSDERQLGWSSDMYGLKSDWESINGYFQESSSSSVSLSSPLGLGWASVAAGGDLLNSMAVGVSLFTGFGTIAAAHSNYALTLSANTQVTFSVELNGLLTSDGNPAGWWGSSGEGHSWDNRSTALFYSASFQATNQDGGLSYANVFGAAETHWVNGPTPYESVIDGQRLQMTFSNKTSSAQSYQLMLDLSLSGREITAPVPEPTTYALMALGLIAIRGVAKRRRA